MTTTTKSKTTTKKSVSKPKVAAAPIQDLPANPFVFEILNLIAKQRTNSKKIEVLRKYEHPSLYKRQIKKAGNEFITEVEKLGDKVYKTISDNPEVNNNDFHEKMVFHFSCLCFSSGYFY